MTLERILAASLGALALTVATSASALGATSTAATAPSATTAPDNRRTAHASLRLDLRRTKAWVGQAIPVTLQAYFRGTEAVTLEGAPQLTSSGIFTSDLGRDPRQSTAIVGGQPALVATWTGTVTPSSAAPLTMTAELPVRVRYRDSPSPVAEAAQPRMDDVFGALANNPFDTSALDRFFQQSMGQPLGRVHAEAVSLRASAGPVAVLDLPIANQPGSFTGAIGKFNLKASLSSTQAQVSEPVTLRVSVDGDGDLDRVDLAGVTTSSDWKAYPPKSTMEAASKGKSARKVFEQILVPLRGGNLAVPVVSLAAFDPTSGTYITSETRPLFVSAEGAAVAAAPAPSSASAPSSSPSAVLALPSTRDSGPTLLPRVVTPTKLALWLSPVVGLLTVTGLALGFRRKRAERSLRRTMRKAAARGDVAPFYQAAHTLIEARLAGRWGVPPETVSPRSIRERLGTVGEPLAEVLAADEAIRFGRGRLDHPDLVPLCSSIERSLGGAT